MLKKNTNKLISALSILETIYEINPRNLNSIELKLEILKVMKNKKLLNVTIERLKKEKYLNENELITILEKVNLE